MNTAAVIAGTGLLVSMMMLSPTRAQPPSTRPGSPVANAAAPKTPMDPVLVTLSGQLKRLLKSSQPLATVSFDTVGGDETLVAQYQTQSFLIYGRSMTGQFAAAPDAEIGPNFQGFRLKLSTRPGHYTGQFVVPQNLRGPYWTTYVNAVPLKGGNRYLWVSFSYGDRIDALLLKQIKQTVLAAGTLSGT